MVTPATSTDELCPGCDQAAGSRWIASTPDTDTWTCTGCGTEWVTTIAAPQGL